MFCFDILKLYVHIWYFEVNRNIDDVKVRVFYHCSLYQFVVIWQLGKKFMPDSDFVRFHSQAHAPLMCLTIVLYSQTCLCWSNSCWKLEGGWTIMILAGSWQNSHGLHQQGICFSPPLSKLMEDAKINSLNTAFQFDRWLSARLQHLDF